MIGSIKVKCKNCGCEAPSEQFKLHYELKQVVCEKCFRSPSQKEHSQKIKNEPPKQPGWDAEDEYLEKMSRIKKEDEFGKFSKIAGTDQVKYSCQNCKFSFKYDPFTKRPSACPYCNGQIPRLKTFNIL